MDELAKYYRIWKKEKLLLGDAWEGGDHQNIFHNGKGKPYYYTNPTAQWAKTKKMYGLKDVRLHDLQHTMVALLMEAGESLSAIQRRIGDASARKTSDIYDHVSEKLENSAVKHFNHFDPRNPAQKQS
ncbi:tyrosine-type recombinase/integrase [Bacillus atrophaeus]|nr:tyrosine-type recombinase/integrase [Bacillus atrophaeus]MCY9115251.1 tyrosine-type recombinase/integrase [Bacillus atrophaeus]MEC0924748.1 tyrosine-type recombinase/integrase [Bacillus atrophaeus]MEC0933362.1 tyrosine-type recombinase/integrase [Bacillus atrophaeus]